MWEKTEGVQELDNLETQAILETRHRTTLETKHRTGDKQNKKYNTDPTTKPGELKQCRNSMMFTSNIFIHPWALCVYYIAGVVIKKTFPQSKGLWDTDIFMFNSIEKIIWIVNFNLKKQIFQMNKIIYF